MIHSFDIDDACKYGVVEATILYNIRFWIARNKANGTNQHEGRTWTYNSMKAFCLLFPYLTEKQLRRAIDKLEESCVLLSGNFNASPYDRTKWYALMDESTVLNVKIDLPKKANESSQMGKTTNTDINTDINTDKENTIAASVDTLPAKSKLISLQTFLTECKEKNERPIRDYEPLWNYTKSVGLSLELVALAWAEFCRQFGQDGAKSSKKYKCWRQAFRNYVENNYLGLWAINQSGQYFLTTKGKQAEKFQEGAE